MSENQEGTQPDLTGRTHGHDGTIRKQMDKGLTEQEARDRVYAVLKNPMAREIVREHRKEIAAQAEETEKQTGLATTDPLTGLYNRLWLNTELPKIIATTKREGAPLAVLLVDLDRFKLINDQISHEAGDEALKEVAAILKRVFSRPGDRVARPGGDELVVVLENTPAEVRDRSGNVIGGARFLANELLAELRSHQWKFWEGRSSEPRPDLAPGASIGITQHRNEDAPTLLDHADRAMYAAKEGGKGRAEVWTPHMDEQPNSPA